MKFKGRLKKALQFNEMQNALREFADLTKEEFVLGIAVAADSAKIVWPELWEAFNSKLSELKSQGVDA